MDKNRNYSWLRGRIASQVAAFRTIKKESEGYLTEEGNTAHECLELILSYAATSENKAVLKERLQQILILVNLYGCAKTQGYVLTKAHELYIRQFLELYLYDSYDREVQEEIKNAANDN